MAARVAVLIPLALLLVGGCLKAPPAGEAASGCGSCHAPHYVQVRDCHGCHRGDPAAARKDLAHAGLLTGGAAEHALPGGPVVREGRQLVERLACRRCHTIGGEGNRLATDLDSVVWKREQEQLAASIAVPVENMPDFRLERLQVDAVIAFLLSAGHHEEALDSYRVLFDRGVADTFGVFDEKCGGCHRFLGPIGPRGRASAGPNLSGLFTPFYPKTAPGDRSWTAKDLAAWVSAPRSFRPATTMPPISLTEGELQRVTSELGAGTMER